MWQPFNISEVIVTCVFHCSSTLLSFCVATLGLRSGHSAESRNIVGICNSILATGYHAEESIISRDVLAGFNKLRFGNGMKRGLAVKLVCLGIAESLVVYHQSS